MGDLQTFKRADVLFKFIELVLSAVCTGLVSGRYHFTDNWHKVECVYGTYIGFTILGSVIVVSYFLDTPLNKKLLMLLAFIGGGLFIASGAFNLESYDKYRHRDDKILGAGIAALVNGVIYFIDVFLSWRAA